MYDDEYDRTQRQLQCACIIKLLCFIIIISLVALLLRSLKRTKLYHHCHEYHYHLLSIIDSTIRLVECKSHRSGRSGGGDFPIKQ